MADAGDQAAAAIAGLVFDPSMKKKKKKKIVQDDDEAEQQQPPAAAVESAAEPTTTGESAADTGFGELPKKKKKKKPVALDDDEDDEDDQAADDGDEDGDGSGDEDPFALSGTKKKKVGFSGEDEVVSADKPAKTTAAAVDGASTWEGTDRDYTYDEVCGRIFSLLRANNPDLQGVPRRFVMKPPQLVREGTKKTVFVNFPEICKIMHRPPDHVLAFLLAELGTSGSVDGNMRLVIKGRLQQKHIESMLRRYISEYVTCQLCRSPDTTLTKENRLYFLRCESCGAKRSVAAIKYGYMAQIGKRKKKP